MRLGGMDGCLLRWSCRCVMLRGSFHHARHTSEMGARASVLCGFIPSSFVLCRCVNVGMCRLWTEGVSVSQRGREASLPCFMHERNARAVRSDATSEAGLWVCAQIGFRREYDRGFSWHSFALPASLN